MIGGPPSGPKTGKQTEVAEAPYFAGNTADEIESSAAPARLAGAGVTAAVWVRRHPILTGVSIGRRVQLPGVGDGVKFKLGIHHTTLKPRRSVRFLKLCLVGRRSGGDPVPVDVPSRTGLKWSGLQ